MSTGTRTFVLLAAASLLILSALALTGYMISRASDLHVTLRSSQPRVALRDARQALENGQLARAVPGFARAAVMVVDSSLRWRIADTYVRQSEELFRHRQVERAFESCTTAAQVLGPYDGGTNIEHDCWDLHLLLYRQER